MKHLLSTVLTALFLTSFSQTTTNLDGTFKYRVTFKNKQGTPYTIQEPEKFLSQKSIERRKKYGIAINETDLPVSPTYIKQLAQTGVTIQNTSKWLNQAVIHVTKPEQLEAVKQLNFIEKIEKNAIYKTPKRSSDDEEKLNEILGGAFAGKDANNKSEGLAFDYGKGSTQAKMININLLHELGFTGKNMTVAILDGGFRNVHKFKAFASLREKGQILGYKDFASPNSPLIFENANSHGAMVLSVMGVNYPSKLVGTAPDASFWLIRTEEDTEYPVEEDNWAAGAEFADSVGVDLINSSLGYTLFDDTLFNHTWKDLDGETAIVTRAANMAAQKGILVCNSAGNAAAEKWHKIGMPADAKGILTVGAVGKDGTYAYFSSVGPTADGRIKPNVTAHGFNCYAAGAYVEDIIATSGTSFSGPIICGATACLIQAHPDASPSKIIDALEISSSQANTPDEKLGYGIPNYDYAHKLLSGQAFFSSVFYNKESKEIKLNTVASYKSYADIRLLNKKGKALENFRIEFSKGTNLQTLKISKKVKSIFLKYENGQTETLTINKN